MRRVVIAWTVLGVLLTVPVLASTADARIGSGGSSGSRGSRSYSAPRVPASPVAPTGPMSPSRQPAPVQPAPQRPGGLFGGLGGMLGGFLLGGLLGSLLFGGLGRGLGGFGLVDILVVGGLVYLAVALLRRRQPAPAMAGGSTPGEWAAAGPSTEEARGAVAVGDGEPDRGIAAIRLMDPTFDPVRFTGTATDLFYRLQAAWGGRDLSSVRAFLTDEMAGALEADFSRLKTLRRVNRIEGVSVEAAEVTEAWQESGRDFVTVRIAARALDWTVDEATGAVVEGSASTPTSFVEYWTLTRPVGPGAWRLSAIQQPPA